MHGFRVSGNGAEAERCETETTSDERKQIRNITAVQSFANGGRAGTSEAREGNNGACFDSDNQVRDGLRVPGNGAEAEKGETETTSDAR